MRLACARPTDKHHVLRRVSELQRAQLLDQCLIHLGSFKVKACQVTVQREVGRLHLVAYLANSSLGVFGLQQVFDQPTRSLNARVALTAPGLRCTSAM